MLNRCWKTAPSRQTLPRLQQQFATANSIANTKSYERETVNSRTTRARAQLQRLAPGSGHANADEQSRSGSRGSSGPIDRLRRHRTGRPKLGMFRRHCPVFERARKRRDPARSIWQAGRQISHPRRSPASTDRELQSGWSLVELRTVQQTRTVWANDVWTDDGRFLDLHWQPGDCAGHVRNVWRSGGKTFRRKSHRQTHCQRRPWWDGRRPTVGRDYEWRMLHRGRSRSGADREATRYRILRSHGEIARSSIAVGR